MAQTHWTSPLFKCSPLSTRVYFFFPHWKDGGLLAEVCAARTPSSCSECLFFSQVFLGTFVCIKALHIQRCGIISWNALDVFHSFSKPSSSEQPLPLTPACSLSPMSSCSSHRLKHPCSSSDGILPNRIATSLSFPVPLYPETLQCASCPSCLKAGFCLLSSARATKPLLSAKVAGCPLRPLCLVQNSAGRGRSVPGARPDVSCPHCGAGEHRGQN